MTKEQLKHFIKVRNESGFTSNLQFGIDADECGFKVEELGTPHRIKGAGINFYTGWSWDTPHGELREIHGNLSLVD